MTQICVSYLKFLQIYINVPEGENEGWRVATPNGFLIFDSSGSGYPPSLNHALWNIGILLHNQATHAKHFKLKCINFLVKTILSKS